MPDQAVSTYDEIRIVRNTEGPWPWSAVGYDRDPVDDELVLVNTCDGDTPEEALHELATERKPA